jgi:hypothetical protein
MITTHNKPDFSYCINKAYYKNFTKLTEDRVLVHTEHLDHLYNSLGEYSQIITPEAVSMMLFNDFHHSERVDLQVLPDIEAGDFHYFNTHLKINGQEVYVAYDIQTFQSTTLIGITFINHLRVQSAIDSLRTQESPF